MTPRSFFFAALLALFAAGTARAQTGDPLAGAMRSYQDLEYDSAAARFRAVLSRPVPVLADSQRVRALMHLGATEMFRERRDSATAAFRALVLLDPRYRPDQLRFPPEVASVFQEVRLATRAVAAVLPPITRLGRPGDRLSIRLYASALHEITAAIGPAQSQVVTRAIYSGAIGDSLELLWDGRDARGTPADSGPYLLRITSRNAEGRAVRLVTIPIEITRVLQDTLPVPAPPADSLLRSEHTPGSGGGRALLAGLLTAGAAVMLPSLAGSDNAMTARYAVAGVLSVAGVAGLLKARRPRPVTENIAYNRQVRAGWEREAARIHEQNITIRREQGLLIRTGTATARELP